MSEIDLADWGDGMPIASETKDCPLFEAINVQHQLQEASGSNTTYSRCFYLHTAMCDSETYDLLAASSVRGCSGKSASAETAWQYSMYFDTLADHRQYAARCRNSIAGIRYPCCCSSASALQSWCSTSLEQSPLLCKCVRECGAVVLYCRL